ncbi:MAG: 16S rRNA processing protein RimM [Desulfobulbaceae bacterium]|nr:16S rRNA processing protein RimM [Desulfobulbaceae bacterium]
MTTTGDQSGDFVLLGKVTKPHGLRGEVKVYPYSDMSESFTGYGRFYLSVDIRGDKTPHTSEKSRVQGKQVILKFKGCSTRNEAEGLVHQHIWIKRQDLPGLDDDEFYLHDLIGKQVEDQGRIIGEITNLLTGGAHDILAVRGEEKEYLIPLVSDFLVRIEQDTVVLDLPPGLLDINT